MATTSFTLRKTSVGFGSYTQGTGQDTSIRSDSFVDVLSLRTTGPSTFSANVINPDEVLLSWDLSFSFETSASVPSPIALRIVASPTGEPMTVQDGVTVLKTSSNTVTSYTDVSRTSEGRWVYYSLFIQYSDFGTPTPITWYERVAYVYVQIPRQYQSVNNLWNRIPEYYRNLDGSLPTQPLYNFIELFGWELDRTRTLIETVALSNDPDIAVAPAIRELAHETGIEFDPITVGTTRTRSVLNSIGYLRRRKGTVESVSSYLSALTGCQVTYDSFNLNWYVHSQRINFVVDPQFTQALGAPTNGTSPYKTKLVTSSTYGVYTYAPTTASAASVTALGTSLVISVPNSGTGNTIATVYSRTSFPRWNPSYYYTSFEPTVTGGASFAFFNTSTTLQWEAYSAGAGASYNMSQTAQVLPQDPNSPGATRVQIDPINTTETTTTAYPYLVFVIPPGGSVTVAKWMVEPNSIGEYFDGNSREGGLIPQTTGYGTGTSDYRWAGTTNQSFSYYMLDYQKIYSIAQNIVRNYLVPVTIKDSVTVSWDYYFGK